MALVFNEDNEKDYEEEIIDTPETFSKPVDGRVSGRTKSLSLKVKPSFHQTLKKLAAERACQMTEIMEEALADYVKKVEKLKRNKPK